MRQRDHVPDFLQQHIPSPQVNEKLHDELTADLMTQRNNTEKELVDMLSDVAADGTPLDPKRDIEETYHAASARHNQCNLDMWHAYIRENTPAVLMDPSTTNRPPMAANDQESSSHAPPTRSTDRKRRHESGTPLRIAPKRSEIHPRKIGDENRQARRDRDGTFYGAMPPPASESHTRTKREKTTAKMATDATATLNTDETAMASARVAQTRATALRHDRSTALWDGLRRVCQEYRNRHLRPPTREDLQTAIQDMQQMAARQLTHTRREEHEIIKRIRS
jgi:hypothetical protein